jgi:hypothetical protein
MFPFKVIGAARYLFGSSARSFTSIRFGPIPFASPILFDQWNSIVSAALSRQFKLL